MKRGQSISEYAFLIGVMAVAVTAMLVYISRGFQGNIRNSADQIGAGQYAPGSTSLSPSSNETKKVSSKTVSTSNTTTVYGKGGGGGAESPAMKVNKEAQRQLKITLAGLQQEKFAITGINPVLNQAAFDAQRNIASISRAGIGKTATDQYGVVHGITAAKRTQQLGEMNIAITGVRSQLTTLYSAYTAYQTEYSGANSTRRAELDTLMAENLAQQRTVNGALDNLNKQRGALATGTPGGIQAVDRAQALDSIGETINNLTRQLNVVLPAAYTALRTEQSDLSLVLNKTSAQQRRWDELPGLMAENLAQQTGARNAISALNAERTTLKGIHSSSVNIPAVNINTAGINPVVPPVAVTRTLAMIQADIDAIAGIHHRPPQAGDQLGRLDVLAAEYQYLSGLWNSPKTENETTSTSQNTETGQYQVYKTANETLDLLPN